MTDLIRPDDVTIDKATVVAASFLASYRGKTRELYTTNLKLWFRWCERHAISPLDVNSMGYADARQVSYYDRDKDSLSRNATHMVSAFVEGA